MFLDRIAPSEPIDNVVVWTDDEEPADPRLHMFAPEHRRKGFRPSSVSEENEQILDELANSEMSYPHDEHGRASGGVRKQQAGLENFGHRGWTPQPTSPAQQYAMPSARQAGAHSRPGSRVPSRMERPASARPALEIDIKAPSVSQGSADGLGVRSLAATDVDLYNEAGGYATPRMKSPPPAGPSAARKRVVSAAAAAPLKSPFKTPQGLAASVALPASRAPSAMGVSRPGSRMLVRDAPQPQETHVRTPKSQFKTPIVNNVTLNTGHGPKVIEAAPSDEHVLGHVHEVVEDEPDVVVVREEIEAAPETEDHYGDLDDQNIGHHIQEHYDVVDNKTYRSTTPKARPDALVLREYPETEIVDVEGMDERRLVEMLKTPEVYKLRKRNAHGSPRSHATWEIEEEEPGAGGQGSVLAGEENALPEIPDSDYYRSSPTKGRMGTGHRRQDSNSQTGVNTATRGEHEGGDWVARFSEPDQPPPWLKINQRLLNWAVIWPFSELENSLKSCERGEQVDEVALTIWAAQIYKRYVRAQMTSYPPVPVDKMFVPPNIADAINNAAYNGRHEEVSVMLRELWAPFGFKGHPKLILALTKHRREENHWVVHRFSLADASIVTYDTYLEKALPDGRPLGWWFGIRMAFPSDAYPPPDQVMQRMIRLHRPLQLQVDNSLAAGAIWRNLIMGSKADRLVDLDRLRDLVRQEVKGIRGKKEQGKLSVSASKSSGTMWPSGSGMIEA
ncbi:hypothetical protein FRC18_010727 [Serendipita sp. 400]|nr:hypothetical protein FRC18_010727 [Serendipita sp. 400]